MSQKGVNTEKMADNRHVVPVLKWYYSMIKDCNTSIRAFISLVRFLKRRALCV